MSQLMDSQNSLSDLFNFAKRKPLYALNRQSLHTLYRPKDLSAVKLDIILVHGSSNRKEQTSLEAQIKSIAKRLGFCRLHVFAFEVTKLLHDEWLHFVVAEQLFSAWKDLPDVDKVAFVAYQSAAWIVRACLTTSRFQSDIDKCPVGLIDIAFLNDFVVNASPNEGPNATKDAAAGSAKNEENATLLSYRKRTNQEFQHYCQDLSEIGVLQITAMESSAIKKSQCRTELQREHTGASQNSTSSKGSIYVEEESIEKALHQFSNCKPALLSDFPKRVSRGPGSHPGPIIASQRRQTFPLGTSARLNSRNHRFSSKDDRTAHRSIVDETLAQSAGNNIPSAAHVPAEAMSQSLDSLYIRKSTASDSPRLYFPEDSTHSAALNNRTTVHSGLGLSYDSLLREARKHRSNIASSCLLNGDLAEAERLYKDLFSSYQARIFGLNIRDMKFEAALEHFKGGEQMESEANFEQLQALFQLALIDYVRGDYKKSERSFKALHGLSAAQQQNNATHRAFLTKVTRWVASSQWKLGRYKDACRTLEDHRELLPRQEQDDPYLLSTYALVLAFAGLLKKSLELSTKALKLIPDADGTLQGQLSSRYFNHALILCWLDDFEEAEKVNRQALEEMKQHLGPNRFVALDAISLEAWLLVASSKTAQAAEKVHQVLRETMERKGANHPSTLKALRNLVLAYKSDGRYTDAENNAQYLVTKSELNTNLGKSHPQTLESKTILAEILVASGKFHEAKGLQNEVMQLKEKERENDYAGLLICRTAGASVLREVGDWNSALELSLGVLVDQIEEFENGYENASKVSSSDQQSDNIRIAQLFRTSRMSKKCPKDRFDRISTFLGGIRDANIRPSITRTLHCLALCEQIRDDAELPLANEILKLVQKACERRLGKKHRLTVDVQYDLAVNYRLRGQFQQGLETITKVLELRGDHLVTDHPDYLQARHERAVALFRLGRWMEALKEQKDVVKSQESILGHNHPSTVLSRFTLAGIYHSLGGVPNLEAARKLIEEVITTQRAIYTLQDDSDFVSLDDVSSEVDHPIVMRSRARLALVLKELRRFSEAIEEQDSVTTRRGKLFGKNASITRSSRIDLAQVLQASGDYEQRERARQMYVDLEEQLQSRPKSPIYFRVRSSLASCYFEQDEIAKAQEKQEEILKEITSQLEQEKDVYGATQGATQRLIVTKFNLALTLKRSGELTGQNELFDRAKRFLNDAILASGSTHGKDHPQSKSLLATKQSWDESADYPSNIGQSAPRSTEIVPTSSIIDQGAGAI